MKARLVAELQVRRLPVMNHQKRLVGIVSLADLATEGSLPKTARALHGISQRGIIKSDWSVSCRSPILRRKAHSPRQLVRCTESPNGVGNTIKLPEV